MLYQQNTTKMNGGKITLYKRSDLEISSWHYRFRFEQRDIRKSAKTTDLNDAKDVANDHFHECRVKLKEGLPIFDYQLKDVAEEFLRGFDQKNITPQKRRQRKAFYKGMLKYWVEFYGDKPINRISQKDITEYLPWRLSYWLEGPGTHKKRPPQAKDTPSDTTLEFEFGALKAVYSHALRRGYVAHSKIPTIKYDGGGRGTRPALTLEQYKTISDAGYKWVDEAAGKPYHWKRWMTLHYFHIMTLSGMRVNEARNLKWCDREVFKDKNGDTNIRLNILQTKTRGKPRRRKSVPFIRASYWFWSLANRPWNTASEDLVFCKKDGTAYRDFSRGFNKMLESAGITHDRDGLKYTIYSLRHTFFTFQLYHGEGASLFEIAKTGGTSEKQLQDTYIKANSTLSAPKLRGLDGDTRRPPVEGPWIGGDAAKRRKRKKKADIIKHPHALNQV